MCGLRGIILVVVVINLVRGVWGVILGIWLGREMMGMGRGMGAGAEVGMDMEMDMEMGIPLIS